MPDDDTQRSDDNTQYRDNRGDFDVPERPLPQDYATPAAPPDDVPKDKNVTADFPATDSGIDEHEKYDAGLSAASGATYQHEETTEDERRIG